MKIDNGWGGRLPRIARGETDDESAGLPSGSDALIVVTHLEGAGCWTSSAGTRGRASARAGAPTGGGATSATSAAGGGGSARPLDTAGTSAPAGGGRSSGA